MLFYVAVVKECEECQLSCVTKVDGTEQDNFKRNGGMLLHQQTSTGTDAIERTKIFTSNELERATDNFNENRILHRGGQGMVYKGMLQIAAQSAEALANIHSSSHTPIYHRDIKTFNILLDDKYRAKEADFGTSKTIEIDESHNSRLCEIIDAKIVDESKKEELEGFADLAQHCLQLNGKQRPTMKEVATRLLMVNTNHSNLELEPPLKQNSRLYDIVDVKVIEEAQRCLNLNGKHRPTMKEVATKLVMLNTNPYDIDLNPSKRDLVACTSMKEAECSFTTYASSLLSRIDLSSRS
ncbi:hypothetical protein V2J09_013687 [Rumex salicifolius]